MSTVDFEWRISDPRQGDDRRFLLRGEEVSAAEEGLWIAEGPSVDWTNHAHFLNRAAAATRQPFYVTFLPWLPGIVAKTEFFRERLSPVVEISDGLLIAAPATASVSDALQVRSKLGGQHSGLWSFGATDDFESLVELWRGAGEEADSPILGSVAARRVLSLALCLDDGVDMLLLRLSERTALIPNWFLATSIVRADGLE